ncbi:MAG: HlyC/CorC family transporter [Lachnospiraceae bacterium]|nr:HlyC/CorC family transporter [Lachnospiraceae bacterium]
MDTVSIVILLIIFALIAFSAFFSSAETAMMSASKIKIRNLADEGNEKAKLLLKLLENQSKMLSTILIGNNIVNIIVSSLTTILAQKLFGNIGITIGTAIITVVVLIFGEITPKTAASINAEKMAIRYARIIYIITIIFTPIIWIINSLAFFVMKLFKINTKAREQAITESELRSIVDVSHEEGVLEEQEKKIINNLIDFGDDKAEDIMVPKIDVTCVDINASYEELMAIFKEEMYTRMPVYEDSTENIVGIINMKDLVLYKQDEPFNVRDFLREAHFTFEGKPLSELMLEMKKDAVSMMIVIDEYGAAVGIITLEDLLEEIVGEIRDEYDADEFDELQQAGDNEYVVEGQMRLDDFNDNLGTSLESDDYETIGGYIMGKIDRIPKAGDVVFTGNVKLSVESVDNKRIDKVRVDIM